MLKSRIEADLKAAMLSGNVTIVDTLKMIKSAILYKEVELGNRDTGLSDGQVIDVLSKEAKKRLEASSMYADADRVDRAAAEKSEYEIIASYLPQQMSDDELQKLVDSTFATHPEATIKDMGTIIGAVKAQAGASVVGSRIAKLVKQKLS